MLKTFDPKSFISVRDAHHYLTTRDDVISLDATFLLPNEAQTQGDSFVAAHLPKARLVNFNALAARHATAPNTLPPQAQFEQAMSDLGVKTTDAVILYSQNKMMMGPPRLWWMMKNYGHDNVMLLDGTLKTWRDAGLPTETGEHSPTATDYIAAPFNTTAFATQDDVLAQYQTSTTRIIDARGAARFSGHTPEPRHSMRSGHIPHSTNIPYASLVNDDGTLKSPDVLTSLLRDSGITDDTRNIIATCGSGITACALYVVLDSFGVKNLSVYDGSWSEWGQEDAGTPVATSPI